MSKKNTFFFLFICTASLMYSLNICAFQVQINQEEISSFPNFSHYVENLISENPGYDFYIFPEYVTALGVFSLMDSTTAFDPGDLHGSVNELNSILIAFWEELSRTNNAFILAGTTIYEEKNKLYNKALLFSPQEGLFYTQNKVFRGDPEIHWLNLSAGAMNEVKTFEIEGIKMGLTICRDTYNPVWNDLFSDIDLWIDIKGNELPYSEDYFYQALPSRLEEHPSTPYGLTLSLLGDFGNLHFEGLSFLNKAGKTLLHTQSFSEPEALCFSIPFSGLSQ